MLTQVAVRLGKTLSSGELAARIGGDEFVVDRRYDDAHALARRAHHPADLGAVHAVDRRDREPGIGIGIALDDGHGSPTN